MPMFGQPFMSGMSMAPPESSAGQSAGVRSVFDYHLSVHNHVVYSHRVVLRVVLCGVGFYRGWIENHNVWTKAIPQNSTIG